VSSPLWSKISRLRACRILIEDNKEKKNWWMYPQGGDEPRISCVVVSLCILCVLLFR
jgi:hypothetical protein